MALLRKGNPYLPGYAIPQNVIDEPYHRGAYVSKYTKRGTIGDAKNPRDPGCCPPYILPQSVRDEPYGQGVRTTHYQKRGTISRLVPDQVATRNKTERIGVGGVLASEGGVFDSRRKVSSYGSLGQVRKAPSLPSLATAVTVKPATTTVAATAVAAPPPVGSDWGRAENFKTALKAATVLIDQVFKVFAPTTTKARLQELGVPKTPSGDYDITKARLTMLQAMLKQVNPIYYSAFVAEKSMPPTSPSSLRDIKGRWTQVWPGVKQPQQVDLWKWRLAKVFDKISFDEIMSFASGRTPTGGFSGLGGWTSWVKKRVTWGTVATIIAGPGGFLIGAALPDITEKGLQAVAEGIRDGLQKVADVYCEFSKTGVPQQAAAAYATTQGGPQAGQVANQAAAVLNTMCSPEPLPDTMGPPSEFPLVPVLIGGGVLLGIMLLTR